MVYQTCSMRSVIARIIRNTRVQDTSFIADMHDWLWEAIGMLKTRYTLQAQVHGLTIDFHKGKLPSGTVVLDAVQYKGRRLSYNNSVRSVNKDFKMLQDSTVFKSLPDEVLQKDDTIASYKKMVQAINASEPAVGVYYKIDDPGYITTSFADGVVTLYTRRIPCDEDGLPLIPDNENYKQALYWYVRAMMIGAGFQDQVFDDDHCFKQFELIYGPRATGEINYPSPDQMEAHLRSSIRLLPDANYYENFFRIDEAETDYRL